MCSARFTTWDCLLQKYSQNTGLEGRVNHQHILGWQTGFSENLDKPAVAVCAALRRIRPDNEAHQENGRDCHHCLPLAWGRAAHVCADPAGGEVIEKVHSCTWDLAHFLSLLSLLPGIPHPEP